MRTILFGIILLCALAPGNAFAVYELPLSGRAKATFVQGKVEVVSGNMTLDLKKGGQLKAPSEVVLKEGARLELLLPDGSVLRFAENTRFTLVSAEVEKIDRKIDVDVALGDCWAKVKGILGEESEFTIKSPTAVAGVSGTVYRAHVDPSEAVSFYVYDGKIAVGYRPVSPQYHHGMTYEHPSRVPGPTRVEGPKRITREEWLVIVSYGYMFRVDEKGKYNEPQKFDLAQDREDPWVQWNMKRDAALDF